MHNVNTYCLGAETKEETKKLSSNHITSTSYKHLPSYHYCLYDPDQRSWGRTCLGCHAHAKYETDLSSCQTKGHTQKSQSKARWPKAHKQTHFGNGTRAAPRNAMWQQHATQGPGQQSVLQLRRPRTMIHLPVDPSNHVVV